MRENLMQLHQGLYKQDKRQGSIEKMTKQADYLRREICSQQTMKKRRLLKVPHPEKTTTVSERTDPELQIK